MIDTVYGNKASKDMKAFSFGVFTDMHYAPDRVYGDRFCKDSLKKLKACIEWFNQVSLSFIVCLGDAVDKTVDKDSQLSCLHEVEEVLSGFKRDTHFVLGNHDVEMLTKEEFLKNCGTRHQKRYYSFEAGKYHFIILDGNYREDGAEYASGNFKWTDACISSPQKEWLLKDMEEAEGKKVIVFIHQNIDHRFINNAVDPHIVSNAGEIRSILEKSGKAVAVFQGHYHSGYYQKINGIHYITEAAMVVGEGTIGRGCHIVTISHDNQMLIEDSNGNKRLFRL